MADFNSVALLPGCGGHEEVWLGGKEEGGGAEKD